MDNDIFQKCESKFTVLQELIIYPFLVGGFSRTHLKNMIIVKLDHFPKVRGDNKKNETTTTYIQRFIHPTGHPPPFRCFLHGWKEGSRQRFGRKARRHEDLRGTSIILRKEGCPNAPYTWICLAMMRVRKKVNQTY